MSSSTKTGSTLRIAMPPEHDQATAIGYTRRKLGEVWTTCGSSDVRVDRQTDRQTVNAFIAILRSSASDRVNITVKKKR